MMVLAHCDMKNLSMAAKMDAASVCSALDETNCADFAGIALAMPVFFCLYFAAISVISGIIAITLFVIIMLAIIIICSIDKLKTKSKG
mgnify:CR=1 FL=1